MRLLPSAVIAAVVLLAGYMLGHAMVTPSASDLARYYPPPLPASPSATPVNLTDIGRAALSRTVTIESFTKDSEEFGTGWLLDAKGDFVTNAHVVANAILIRVRDRAGNTHSGKIEGSDVHQDVALVRSVDGFTGAPLPTRTGHLEAGDSVVAVASSRATGHGDITIEEVAALASRVHATADAIDPQQATTTAQYYNMLEIGGAQIYPGNSGGPLLDSGGNVIGIVTLAGKNDDLAYAIPIGRVVGELTGFARKA